MKKIKEFQNVYKNSGIIESIIDHMVLFDKYHFVSKRLNELSSIIPKNPKQYKYIPFDTPGIVSYVVGIFELLKVKLISEDTINILDLGCGNGRILSLLKRSIIQLGRIEFDIPWWTHKFSLTGIENNKALVNALNYEDTRGAKIINKDILKSSKEISEADIIFSFIPTFSPDLISQMLETILTNAKSGTILLLPGFWNIEIENFAQRLNRHVFEMKYEIMHRNMFIYIVE